MARRVVKLGRCACAGLRLSRMAGGIVAFGLLALVFAQGSLGQPGPELGTSLSARQYSTFPVPTHNALPYDITAGPGGNLWFTEYGAGKIGRITPSGAITEFKIPTPGAGGPSAITAGAGGLVWFTVEGKRNEIGRITASGAISAFSIPTANSGPSGITAGREGDLWFTEQQANQIGRITPAGVVTEFQIPTLAGPYAITTGREGDLWFTEQRATKIGRITPSGSITEFPISSEAYGITTGREGDLWFTGSGNEIGRLTPSGALRQFELPVPGSGGREITLGPGGDLWFAQQLDNLVGRITPSGTISEFNVSTARESRPYGIAMGPGATIWFTAGLADSIGRIKTRLLPAAPKCVVPKLKGKTLTQAEHLLGSAHCKLGKVSPRSRPNHAHVVAQQPSPGKSLPGESSVSVRLG